MSISLDNKPVQTKLFLAKSYIKVGLPELAQALAKALLQTADTHFHHEINTLLATAKNSKQVPLNTLDHNVFYRLKSLTDHLNGLDIPSQPRISIHDVGGGNGQLCLFLPQANYTLAEPTVNSLSGIEPAFEEKKFDVVVSCQVLEHIPQQERTKFLESLCKMAKYHVILLNPFFVEDSYETERLKLAIELTNASWAKEHLDCSLPSLQDIKQFAKDREIGVKIFPNGTLTTTLAMVFVSHYANKAGCAEQMKKINSLYNTRYFDKLVNPDLPTGYLVQLDLQETSIA
ncbi:MAG: methyltransferase domain-containing protein [Pseudomonadota bacterium]